MKVQSACAYSDLPKSCRSHCRLKGKDGRTLAFICSPPNNPIKFLTNGELGLTFYEFFYVDETICQSAHLHDSFSPRNRNQTLASGQTLLI